jgi:hypothetical protein
MAGKPEIRVELTEEVWQRLAEALAVRTMINAGILPAEYLSEAPASPEQRQQDG